MRVLGLSGSLRSGSHNTALLRAAALTLPPAGRLVLWEGLRDIPPFDEDREACTPVAVAALRRELAAADALLIATPEYNASIPGQLKNALDWASRPFATSPLRGKPVAVVGASTGLFGAVWAQAEARRVLEAIGARVLDAELPVGSADDAFDPTGALADPDQATALAAVLADLAAAARSAAPLAA